MDILSRKPSCDCEPSGRAAPAPSGMTSIVPFILSSPDNVKADEPCCGAPAGPAASPYEKPGYRICPFVDGFLQTNAGFIPRVKTRMTPSDRWGTLRARMNIGRNTYSISPGLYAVGNPDQDAPVLVTSNFKLTFDRVRMNLGGVSAYILVLDTRGINVWCAAGKGNFGTDELVNRVRRAEVSGLVSHKKLILPQLGATGISARQVKKQTGFSVIWGPVHCRDLKRFLKTGMTPDPSMRQVTFDLWERMVLIPVEISIAAKSFILMCLAAVFLSGIGPHLFSLTQALHRGWAAVTVLLGGLIAGAVLTPVLLDRLPGTMFSVKGAVAGLIVSIPLAFIMGHFTGFTGMLALVLAGGAVSSYLAMNFTGSTPFTSPSGVEKEMKTSMPFQAASLVTAVILWLVSVF